MARIAILADIHGNWPALEATLRDLRAQRVDEVLVGGDLVGRGPEGSRVARAIRERGWRCVRGNHEDYLLAFRRDQIPVAWHEEEAWNASRWMAAELDDHDVDYIDSLPFSLRAASSSALRLVHGTPRSHSEGIGPWSTDDELGRHFDAIDEPVLVCGHTHRPLDRELAGRRVVNVGAVGLPFNRDPRAQYAILHERGDGWRVEFRRVAYDLERIRAVYRSSGFREKGGITARLLELELEHAAPFLVPFLKWAESRGAPPRLDDLNAFLDFYDPDEPRRAFLARLGPMG